MKHSRKSLFRRSMESPDRARWQKRKGLQHKRPYESWTSVRIGCVRLPISSFIEKLEPGQPSRPEHRSTLVGQTNQTAPGSTARGKAARTLARKGTSLGAG